jgi:hypothetical protein
MAIFGTIRPKLIAKMIVMAVRSRGSPPLRRRSQGDRRRGLNYAHRRSHATHGHTGGIGRDCGDQSGVAGAVLGLKFQLSRARHDFNAQSQSVSEALGRSQDLVGRLTVDVLNPSSGEDKVGTVLQGHGVVIPIQIHKAASRVVRYEMSIRAFLEYHVSPLPWLVID